MKKIILTVSLLTVAFFSVQAQQQPFYTQYILNPFIVNPALAGIENYWDVKMSYRSQWQGINGAPQTTYLTLHGPLKNVQYSKPTVSTVPPPGRKKKQATNYWLQYKSAIHHAGLGFTFLNDKIGPMNRYAVNVTYAYHIGLSPKTSLSAGLAGGLQGIDLNTDLLDFGTANPVDPSVAVNGVVTEIRPDLSFGLWLYSAFYFVGASIQNMVPLKINYSTTLDGNIALIPHVLLSGGYKILINDNFNFLPSTMVRVTSNSPVNVDVNLKVQYQNLAWAGVSYRHSQSVATMLGFNINNTLNVGYSYDITYSNLRYAAGPTHEIVLGILLGNKNRVSCPMEFW